MFAPPGYVVMQRVDAIFRAKAKSVHPDPPAPEAPDRNLTLFEREVGRIRNARSELRDIALARFLRECGSLSACTLSGAVWRVSPTVVAWGDTKSVKNPRGFWFIDRATWQVSTKKVTEWLSASANEIIRLSTLVTVYEKHGMGRLASEARLARAALIGATHRLPPLAAAFTQLEGASITIAEEDAPTSATDLGRYFQTDFTDPVADEDTPQIGRPSKQAIALAAYWKNYPDGHGATSWKQITRVVSEEIGMTVGADTLRRALGLRA